MAHDIKKLLPQKFGRYKQGYIDPSTCTKLFPEIRNQYIIYRSSLEKKFIYWCERSPQVLQWGSECVCIPYYWNRSWHKYYPDFIIKENTGKHRVIEIKPESQTDINKHITEYQQSGVMDYNRYTAIKNACKWAAAKQWCEKRGPDWSFNILTEKIINKL